MSIWSKYVALFLLAFAAVSTATSAKDRTSTLDQAEQTFKAKGDAWAHCMMTAAPRFLGSTESAEAIATAILGTCSAEQNEVQTSLVPIYGLTSPYGSLAQSLPYADAAASNKIADMRNGFRDKFIAIVVERRAAGGSGK